MKTPGAYISEIAEREVARLRFPIDYRPWQLEALLTDSLAIIDRCNDTKRYLDSLWIQWALQEIQLRQDQHESEMSLQEEAGGVDRFPEVLVTSERDILSGLVASRAIGDFSLRSDMNYETSIRSKGFQAQFISSPDDGQTKNMTPQTASGHIGIAQASQEAIEYRARMSRLAAEAEFESKASLRRSTIRKNSAEIRNARADAAATGPLNFADRIQSATENILVPYLLDIRARCLAARSGMAQLFGEDPENLPPRDDNEVEAYGGWIRRAVSWLTRVGHLDQGFVVTASLRSQGVLPSLNQPMALAIPKQLFRNYSYCRLRGMSLFVESQSGSVFRATVRVPRKAVYLDEFGNSVGGEHDQSGMPPCVLGRVVGRASARAPEIGGAMSLINASPLHAGSDEGWIINLESCDGWTGPIEDVHLELTMVGRPVGMSARLGTTRIDSNAQRSANR